MSEETAKPGGMPLPEDAIRSLAEGQQKLADVQAQISSYVAGLRTGLGVPEGWELDLKSRAFVPPNRQAAE